MLSLKLCTYFVCSFQVVPFVVIMFLYRIREQFICLSSQAFIKKQIICCLFTKRLFDKTKSPKMHIFFYINKKKWYTTYIPSENIYLISSKTQPELHYQMRHPNAYYPHYQRVHQLEQLNNISQTHFTTTGWFRHAGETCV